MKTEMIINKGIMFFSATFATVHRRVDLKLSVVIFVDKKGVLRLLISFGFNVNVDLLYCFHAQQNLLDFSSTIAFLDFVCFFFRFCVFLFRHSIY